MKKLFLLLLISSCSFGGMSCMPPSDYEQHQAQTYFDSFSSFRVIDGKEHTRLRKNPTFKCYYRAGDEFYSYSTFIDTKYVLVRGRQAITYIEE